LGPSLKLFDSHLSLQGLALRLVKMPSLQKWLEHRAKEVDCAKVHDDSPSIHSVADFDIYSDNIAVCRKSSASGLPKLVDKLMAALKAIGSSKEVDESAIVHQLVPSVAAAPIPSSSEGNNWTVLSTANVWNSSRCVT
jgi:hypothetical protein